MSEADPLGLLFWNIVVADGQNRDSHRWGDLLKRLPAVRPDVGASDADAVALSVS